MQIFVPCEESQTVVKAFRARGHEAYSCDIIDWLAANYGGRDKIQAADPQYDKSSVTAWAVSEPERIEMAKTNLYRQAGNSIVRGALMAIFSQMGIQGIKKWNDMNDSERHALIYRGCFVNDGQASASECN